MTEKEVIVKHDAGVHARPAMMMVRAAGKFSSSVKLIKGDVEADCKSIMSVLGLAILPGTTLTVRAEGNDEVEAVDAIACMIENNFELS